MCNVNLDYAFKNTKFGVVSKNHLSINTHLIFTLSLCDLIH